MQASQQRAFRLGPRHMHVRYSGASKRQAKFVQNPSNPRRVFIALLLRRKYLLFTEITSSGRGRSGLRGNPVHGANPRSPVFT